MNWSERTKADKLRRNTHRAASQCNKDEEFIGESKPIFVFNICQGKRGHQSTRGGPEIVGKAVTHLVNNNHYLLSDASDLAQWTEDGHQYNCFTAARSDKEVERDYDTVRHQYDYNRIFSSQSIRQRVDDCIDNFKIPAPAPTILS